MTPSKLPTGSLDGVAETLVIPLFYRAEESKRPDALVKDARAVELAGSLSYDFSRVKLHDHDQVGILLCLRQFDRIARDFLARNPGAVVVHFGCGLDTRFDRVDDGLVEWYDLDLPEVMAIRRDLIPEIPRCHAITGSVFDTGWQVAVAPHASRPFLFLAEGVLPYFEETRVKDLVIGLRQHFPAPSWLAMP